ncbi:uncharacterized protein IWZ02DRAFT_113008 [Phyllosticta citriasiana]|uniref:uncharacterized protein n=1 Tax=Phyllosticta citriasiana TaxID=595635 RepID=UPI0030FDA83E
MLFLRSARLARLRPSTICLVRSLKLLRFCVAHRPLFSPRTAKRSYAQRDCSAGATRGTKEQQEREIRRSVRYY